MKTIKKNVYYCDHCSKKGLVATHIRKHEGRCTNNPHRFCGVCEALDTLGPILNTIKGRFVLIANPMSPYDPGEMFDPFVNYDEMIVQWTDKPITLEEIRNMVDNCPACVLAVLRQSGLNRHYFHLEKFDFKKELAARMADNNMPKNPYGY